MTSARLAGLAFLAYVATAFVDGSAYGRAAAGTTVTARLASIAQQTSLLKLSIVLGASTVVYALVLAVALYSLTRDVNAGLALFAMTCRVLEAAANMAPPAARIGLLRLAADSSFGAAADRSLHASVLFQLPSALMAVSSTIFALGSAAFAFLLLRGRRIPSWLGVFGVASSLVVLPVFLLRGTGVITGTTVWYANIPLIAFELLLAVRLLATEGPSPSAAARAH